MAQIELKASQTLILPSDEVVKLVSDEQQIELNLIVPENSNCLVYVNLDSSEELNLNVEVKENGKCNILLWNNCNHDVKINEKTTVEQDGVYNVSYGELSDGNVEKQVIIELNGQGASANVSSATVCASKKNSVIDLIHNVPNTTGEMEHYGVIMENGIFRMEATGKIVRGATSSKSHQSTRILTFDKKQNATVLPKLLIDENDVEASHATSLGQPDENQLYYMMSRGLSYRQAMELITLGYLMPIASKIDDEELKSILVEQIESKVEQIWSK